MTARHAHAARARRRPVRMPRRGRASALAGVLLALGFAWISVAVLGVPAAAAAGPGTSQGVERSQDDGGAFSGPAGSGPAASGPVASNAVASPAVAAARAPGRAPVAGLAALRAPDWGDIDPMKTVDKAPGGSFKWDPKTKSVQVCDTEPDGHLVRGYVIVNGNKVVNLRAGADGKCYEERVEDFDPQEPYIFRICLASSDEAPDGYCNFSTAQTWPKTERSEGYCEDLPSGEEKIECVGGVDEYCSLAWEVDAMFPKYCKEKYGEQEETKVLKPPTGRKPDINARPDADLPAGHAAGADHVAEPVRPLLRWLVWGVLGGCILGFFLVGGNMALKHKRSEAGAHAAELSWVAIAVVVAGSGLAVAFLSLLIDPL